jgi:hypothetical protein
VSPTAFRLQVARSFAKLRNAVLQHELADELEDAAMQDYHTLKHVPPEVCAVVLPRVVWCGVVWCGVVWCGVVWCGVVWCGVVWCVFAGVQFGRG